MPTIYVLEQKYEKWVYPCIPQFCYIKVGFMGVSISRTCFPDEHVYKFCKSSKYKSAFKASLLEMIFINVETVLCKGGLFLFS